MSETPRGELPSDELPMKFQTVPARRGAAWVRHGFALFFGRPLAFSLLFVTFLFAVLLLAMVPLIGSLLLLMSLPLVTLGFMIAAERARRGLGSSVRVFIDPLRAPGPRRTALLQLAGAYAVATALVMALSAAVDGGAFDALQDAMMGERVDPQAIAARLGEPRLLLGMALRLGLAALLALPFWHAPALVYWGGLGFAKSLFFSSVACWRNRSAFVVYGLGWVGVILVFSLVVQLVARLLGEPRLAVISAMPAGLLFSTVFYVSLYDTFCDSFDRPIVEAAEPA